MAIPCMGSDKDITAVGIGPFGKSRRYLPQSASNGGVEARAVMQRLPLSGLPTRAGSVHYACWSLFMDAQWGNARLTEKGRCGPASGHSTCRGRGLSAGTLSGGYEAATDQETPDTVSVRMREGARIEVLRKGAGGAFNRFGPFC